MEIMYIHTHTYRLNLGGKKSVRSVEGEDGSFACSFDLYYSHSKHFWV